MPSTVEAAGRLAHQGAALVREPYLAERVICVGGHPGCGKTMMTPIVGSLERVEMQKFNYALEYICSLHLLGRLDDDAATVMIRMLTDLDLYNMTMARETNFRWSDVSSVFSNPGPWRYVRRLFGPGDEAAAARIRTEKPILHITAHNLLAISPPLFAALGDRLRLLEVVRHPLYMVKQWHHYIDRYGTDVRDFTIWFEYQGRSLPFFARGWEERYRSSNAMDRVIYSIEHLTQLGQGAMARLSANQQAQAMIMPFERFVLDPWPYLRRLEGMLGSRVTALTRRELKRQKVPRSRIADGLARPIYREYGWQPATRGSDERRELEMRREYAAQHASAEGLGTLDRMCAAYEAEHLSGIVSLRRSAS